jgi:hypothetical protein
MTAISWATIHEAGPIVQPISVLGIDIAKRVFHVVGEERVVFCPFAKQSPISVPISTNMAATARFHQDTSFSQAARACCRVSVTNTSRDLREGTCDKT